MDAFAYLKSWLYLIVSDVIIFNGNIACQIYPAYYYVVVILTLFFFSFVFYFFFKCLTIWCSRFVLRKMFGKVKQTAFSQIFNSSLNEEKENNFLFRWKKKSWRKTTIKLVFSRNFSTLWWLFFFHSHIKRVQSMSWWLTNIYRKKKCCSYLPKRCTFFGGDLLNIPLY